MDLSTAISHLKKIVKPSEASDGNNHLHLGLVPVEQRKLYQQALQVAQAAVLSGEITREKFNHLIGIE